MTDNQNAAVMGAFVADALSLGVHWVYNTRVIDKKFGRVEGYHDPLTSYHKGKQAGDFTHYGDQTMVLLESVIQEDGFDAYRFASSWRRFFSDYSGYVDQATRTTLENMDAGNDLTASGSNSDDLAGASRLAALLPVYSDDLVEFIAAARTQTAITHNNDEVIASAEFFARTVSAVLKGESPTTAIENVLNTDFANHPIASLITLGMESRERDTRQAIAAFGQACSIDGGLPGAIHLIARYSGDFRTAMIENVMAGGDSSARGMLAGMVLCAAQGMQAIPEKWISEMTAAGQIAKLLKQSSSTSGD
jgi:ADP-ribosylglycohydrolase